MKKLFLLLSSSVLLMACSPDSNFNSYDQRFDSLMDGETVAIVDDQTLADSMSIGEDNLDGESSSNNPIDNEDKKDDGLGGKQNSVEEDDNDDDYTDHSSDDKVNDDNGKHIDQNSCRDRLSKEDNQGRHDDMITSPGEMQISKELYDAIRCGHGNEKKVYLCHYPNGDFKKRKTQCLSLSAVGAHIEKHQGGTHEGHADYAGACRD